MCLLRSILIYAFIFEVYFFLCTPVCYFNFSKWSEKSLPLGSRSPILFLAFLNAHCYLPQQRQGLRVMTSQFSHDQNLDLIQSDLIQPSDTLVSLEEKENLNQAPLSRTCSDRSEGAADQILTPCLQFYFKLIKSKRLGMELGDRSFLVLITYHRKKKVQSGLSVLTQIFTLAKTSMNWESLLSVRFFFHYI